MYTDRRAVRSKRYRINLNQYQREVIDALAKYHRKQAATLLSEIIEDYLDQFETKQSIERKAG